MTPWPDAIARRLRWSNQTDRGKDGNVRVHSTIRSHGVQPRPQGSHTTPRPHSFRTASVTMCNSPWTPRSAVIRGHSGGSSDHPLFRPVRWSHCVEATTGSGLCHGVPVRRIAQQRTRILRARATTAFFLDNPLPCRRSQVSLAQWLYRRLHQAHSTSAARRTFGPRRVMRPRRSVSPLWNCRGTKPA